MGKKKKRPTVFFNASVIDVSGEQVIGSGVILFPTSIRFSFLLYLKILIKIYTYKSHPYEI